MKRFFALLTALAIVISMLGGCSKIPDYEESDSDPAETPGNSGSDSYLSITEASVKQFDLNRQDFIAKLNAEGGVFDGALSDNGEFDGAGYVKLREGDSLTHILNANTTQHYRIILAARSTEGAVVTLEVGSETCGAFYIPKRSLSDGEKELSFEYTAADCIYLTAGQNILRFHVVSGSLDVDYILAESSGGVSTSAYSVASACVNPSASLHTVNVMKYLTEAYGNSVLTAQNVSPASNAEIDAVYNATGRYPAIRAGEIAYALSDDPKDKERLETELALALEWSGKGGLQSYTWHWYSPNYQRDTALSAFNLDGMFNNQLPEDIAMMTDAEVNALVDNGFMSAAVAAILDDIDAVAEVLKRFDDENATVLFHPLPDGDSGLYWWGQSPEIYKILWQLVFDRMCKFHKIKSIIWVWDGSNMDYYPGNNYVDVIGQSFYEASDASFAGQFEAVSELSGRKKILAVSSCDVLPNIDYMFRDNALWLWIAAGSGEFTLSYSGALSESYNSVQYVKYLYNCTSTVALDELPDFSIVI